MSDIANLDDTRGLLMALVQRIRRDGLQLECTPHLMSVILRLDGKEPPEIPGRLRDGHAAVVGALAQLDELVPVLLADCRPHELGGEDRFGEALIFLLEMVAQQRVPDRERLRAIARGDQELASALRAAELDSLAHAIASAGAQLDAAPPVALDPATVARLESMGRLVVGELAIPVPDGARREPRGDGPFSVADGVLSATFVVEDSPTQLRELYRTWARRAGWLVELDEPDPELIHLALARGISRFDVFAHRWLDGNAMLVIRVRAEAARFEPAGPFVAGQAPVWPVVTRPRPCIKPRGSRMSRPDAVLADRGAVFVAASESLAFVDPANKTVETVFCAGRDASLSGLARIDDDVLATDKRAGKVLRIDLQESRARVVASKLSEPSHLAVIGNVAYVGCQPTHIRAIDLVTGAIVGELAAFPALDKLQALCAHGDDLVAVDYRYVVAVDRGAGRTRQIAELAWLVSGVASDGANLYGAVWGGMFRIDRSGHRRELVGRRGSSSIRDGAPDVASVNSPEKLSLDGSCLVFVDGNKLRRLDLTTGYVKTIR